MVEGWQTETAMTVDEALEKYTELGVHHFLITSIAQDGMLNGPDLQTLSASHPIPKRQNHCGRRNRQHRRFSSTQRNRGGRRSHRESPL